MSLTGRSGLMRKQSVISNLPAASDKKSDKNQSLNKKKDNL